MFDNWQDTAAFELFLVQNTLHKMENRCLVLFNSPLVICGRRINAVRFSVSALFFSTQLLLKIPVFELNNRFVFYRTCAVDIQSIVKISQSILYFLTSSDKVASSMNTFFAVPDRDRCIFEAEWLAHSTSVSLLSIEERVRFSCICARWAQ